MFSAYWISSPADQAFLLILIVVVLTPCLVWVIWELENARETRRRKRLLVKDARPFSKSA